MAIDLIRYEQNRALIEKAEEITNCVVKAHAEQLVSNHRIAVAGSAFCKTFNALCAEFRDLLRESAPDGEDLLRLDNEDLYITLIFPLAHTYHSR